MTASNPFDSSEILDGIRRWVEIETPTDVPAQVNKLASLVADLYRGLPATIERVAGTDGLGDHLVARSAWGQDAPGILVLSHLDTVHPMGFIDRLPFKVEGDSAFGPTRSASFVRLAHLRRSASPISIPRTKRSAARPRAR